MMFKLKWLGSRHTPQDQCRKPFRPKHSNPVSGKNSVLQAGSPVCPAQLFTELAALMAMGDGFGRMQAHSAAPLNGWVSRGECGSGVTMVFHAFILLVVLVFLQSRTVE